MLRPAGGGGVDLGGLGRLRDELRGLRQLLLQPGNLGLNGGGVLGPALYLGAFGLVNQLSELEFDSEGVVFESRIVHETPLPIQPGSYAGRLRGRTRT